MCGIAGIWSKENRPLSNEQVKGMLEAMRYRGPDAEGIWNIPGLVMGNKRLKILDLSDAANQPFSDGHDALVFNGRIFNYLVLQKELSGMFDFKTRCDTEVLFRALQIWDERALNKLEGQFAFAFYKESARTLMLARDHVGICPLYLMESSDELYFSSEIKPLLGIKESSLNYDAVVDYFTYRYNIQNGRTLFKGVSRFPPAHFLKIELNTKRQQTRRYWRLRFNTLDRSAAETQDEFNRIVGDEVEAQKSADVPVGVYLSGGIDSGALFFGFSKAAADINAFTLSFSKSDDVYDHVRELTNRIKCKHTVIDFSEENLDRLEEVVFSLEEPFGDLIICANYFLAKSASRDLKVVLSGEGGDEAFCGYDHQRGFFKLFDLGQNNGMRSLLDITLNIIPPWLFGLTQSYPGRFGYGELERVRLVARGMSDPAGAYIQLVSLFNQDELRGLFSRKFLKSHQIEPDTNGIREIFEHDGQAWQSVMRAEIEQLTLIVNLLKQDRFSMRFSMEGCVPFASRRILEFAASLPYATLNSRINKELLLRYSGRRPIRKRPFSLFFTRRYLTKISELMDRYVTYETVTEQGLLSWQTVEHISSRLLTGDILTVKRAIAILIFVVWHKCFASYLNKGL